MVIIGFVARLFQASWPDICAKVEQGIVESCLLSEGIVVIALKKSILILEMLLVLLALQFYAPVPPAESVISLKLEQAARENPVGELRNNVALGKNCRDESARLHPVSAVCKTGAFSLKQAGKKQGPSKGASPSPLPPWVFTEEPSLTVRGAFSCRTPAAGA